MPTPSECTVHMIGHGHIDPTWLWRWTEGFEEVRATFRSALDRMNETPGFRFTASSACFYAWVEQCDPGMFEEIRARVAEGRWETAGGWWIEPDCNVPCGESFVRQGLYAQRYFLRAFGKTARVGFNPDSFGHAGMLPQILKKLGLDYYVYMRPQPVYEMQYPEGATFWWEAPDGTRVLAANIPESYGADGLNGDVAARIRRMPGYLHNNAGQSQFMAFYGVGNHGGGPTKAAIRQIEEVQQDAEAPRAEFSTLEGFFHAFEEAGHAAGAPTIATELQHHARGCYSVHTGVKFLNRRVEHALMNAERLSTLAWHLGALPYPEAGFEAGWRELLYNQFHDILAGTSLESSYEDTRDQLGAARNQADVAANLAIQAIARDIDTTPEGNTIVVFNPLAHAVEQPVTVSPIANRTLTRPVHLVDDTESPCAVQAITGEQVGNVRYAFTANVPALGWRSYHLRSGAPEKSPAKVSAGGTWLENDWWRIKFDPNTGEIASLLDKQAQVRVLDKGNVLASLVDNSDTWSHAVREYAVEAGRFDGASLAVAEAGPALVRMRVRSHWQHCEAVTEVTLHADTPAIDCTIQMNWQARYHLLKTAFDTRIVNGEAAYETAYGHDVRPCNGHEQPGQQWFDLSGEIEGTPYGLTILNDGQYSFDVRDGIMRVTLLRSPAYAHHEPARYDATRNYAIMDQGWHTFRLRLLPHAGPLDPALASRQADAFNAPPVVHVESAHPGTGPSRYGHLAVDALNVVVSVVKKAEDSDDIIIRAREAQGQATEARFAVGGLEAAVSFTPHEIKTLCINPATGICVETDLLERPTEA